MGERVPVDGQAAQDQAAHSADEAHQQRFQQELHGDLTASGAERAAQADLTAAFHHACAGVRLSLTTAPAPVEGDPALLRQVALNLLANAIRHNQRDGTVEVSTGSEGDTAFLEVANTGPVLDPQEIPTLFTPFHQGGGRRGSGFGLGLAVVEAITATHRGTVTATPRAVGGLIVRVRLPAHQRDAAAG